MGKLIVIFTLTGCFLVSCSSGVNKKLGEVVDEVADQVNNVTDLIDPHVLGVKNGHPNNHPKCPYGDVFDEFFASPTWKYFNATSGEEVVEFTGYCTYHDVKVKARLQFILNKDGKTFETGALSFNDVPQSKLITIGMIYKAFSNYIEKHNIKEDTELEEKDLEDIFATEVVSDVKNETENTDTIDRQKISSAIDDVDEDAGSGEELNEYILPESSDRYLEKYELPVTKSRLRIARNEIFARYGRIFKDKELQQYFESTSWYEPSVKPEEFNENVLNKFEKYNVALIAEAEKKAPDDSEKEIYFAGIYKAEGNGTVEMEEYSSPDETAHGINAGYIVFSGFGDERDGQEVQIYRGDSNVPNYYGDYRGFINITVKTDRIIIEGIIPDWEDMENSLDVSGTYYLKERFLMP